MRFLRYRFSLRTNGVLVYNMNMNKLVLIGVIIVVLGGVFALFSYTPTEQKTLQSMQKKEAAVETQDTLQFVPVEVPQQMKKKLDIEMKKMPEMITVASFYKSCLARAQTKDEAVQCYKVSNRKAQALGVPSDEKTFNPDAEFGVWDAQKKREVLQALQYSVEVMSATVR